MPDFFASYRFKRFWITLGLNPLTTPFTRELIMRGSVKRG